MATTTSQLKPEGSSGVSNPKENLSTSRISVHGNHGVKVVRAVTIRKPAAELYTFWSQFENLVQVIKHPITITRISNNDTRWSVSSPPGDSRVEWTATVINTHPGSMIAWRSLEGADVPNAGSVRFEKAPGDEGTEVTVSLEYEPPGGKLGSLFAKFTGKEAGQQVASALRRFKSLMEAGEIPTIDGQSVGEPQRSKLQEEKKA